MTEKQVKTLGFKFLKKYDHTEFTTVVYKKGPMQVDFNYIGKNLEDVDLTMEEFSFMPINIEKLTAIANAIGDLQI